MKNLILLLVFTSVFVLGSVLPQISHTYVSAQPSGQNNKPEDPENPDEQSSGTDDVDCSGDGFSLAWILCPVFELGANVTSDAFENVIKPMLENVPVTTDSKDPFYKAWSNFRLLGNIVLVGAMLVLVYAQARGGGR